MNNNYERLLRRVDLLRKVDQEIKELNELAQRLANKGIEPLIQFKVKAEKKKDKKASTDDEFVYTISLLGFPQQNKKEEECKVYSFPVSESNSLRILQSIVNDRVEYRRRLIKAISKLQSQLC